MAIESIIQQLVEKTGQVIQPEVSDWTKKYSCIQGGSPECEILEFLYSLVRLIKPENILETGTYVGWSAAVMAQAIKENGHGHIETLEIEQQHIASAKQLWQTLELTDFIIEHQKSSLEFEPTHNYDFLFLDSEPQIRFDELAKFYPYLNNSGFIAIHDLHPHLGHSNQTLHDMEHWPFGDFIPKFGNLILDHQLQTFHFRTPRGFTLFQKFDNEFGSFKLMVGQWWL